MMTFGLIVTVASAVILGLLAICAAVDVVLTLCRGP
jgi:hypothetical protein